MASGGLSLLDVAKVWLQELLPMESRRNFGLPYQGSIRPVNNAQAGKAFPVAISCG